KDAPLVDPFEHLKGHGPSTHGSLAPHAPPHRRLSRFYSRPVPCPRLPVHSRLPALPCQFLRRRQAAGEVAKPRDLPFGEVASARLHALDRLGQRRAAVKQGEDFLVSQGLTGLAARRLLKISQASRLLDEAGRKHGLDALIDALVKESARQIEPE